MNWAIKIESLSKLYPIGGVTALGSNLREDIGNMARRLVGLGPKGPSVKSASAPASVLGNGDASSDPSLRGAPPNHFWALRNLNVEIKEGEVLGVIGRNGAGKSTLLKILSRITPPTSGEIQFRGRMASLLEVGTGFHRELTGRENIFLNGSILGMRRAEISRKLDEIVEFAEIGKFLDTPVKFYSSGMYVRLAFAVAAHLETDILLVDEVLAVGDVQFQKKCLGKMQEVATSQGRTVIFVSHHMAAVRRLCTRAMLMERGSSEGLIGVEEAIQRYSRQVQDSPWDIDLSRARRADGHGDTARILAVRLAPGTALRYGEPLEIHYTVACAKPVKEIAIGIGFDTLDGQRVMTLDTDNSVAPFNLDAGTHDVRVRLERNPLHPGTYSCGIAIVSGRSVLDALPGCAVWEVESSEADLVSDRGFAGCRLPSDVRVSANPSVHNPFTA